MKGQRLFLNYEKKCFGLGCLMKTSMMRAEMLHDA